MMLANAVEEVLRQHVPSEERACWPNEKFCEGCLTKFGYKGDDFPPAVYAFRVWPRSEFPAHQAELIAEVVRERLGTR